jgi:hypothetical protein
LSGSLGEEVVNDDDEFPVSIHQGRRIHIGLPHVGIEKFKILWIKRSDKCEFIGELLIVQAFFILASNEMAVIEFIIADCK